MRRGGSFLRIDPALRLILILVLVDGLIDDCSLSLIHGSHGLACKVRGGFVIVERIDRGDFIRAWANIGISFNFIYFFGFGLGPGDSSGLDNYVIRVVLSRAYLIIFLSLEILDRWFIEFELVIVVLVVAIGMNIGRNGGDGLVLVDIDEMFQYFRLCCRIRAHHLRPHL